MNWIQSNQLRAIHALLNDNNLKDEKDSIVQAFTAGRTTHSSKMTKGEAAALIGHLKSLDETDKRATKMRNKILSIAHELGWTKLLKSPIGNPDVKKVDMEHVNNWCLQYGHKKKKLDDYDYNELPMLVTQFEEVYKNQLK